MRMSGRGKRCSSNSPFWWGDGAAALGILLWGATAVAHGVTGLRRGA